jgi:hypothetical protein
VVVDTKHKMVVTVVQAVAVGATTSKAEAMELLAKEITAALVEAILAVEAVALAQLVETVVETVDKAVQVHHQALLALL